MAMLDATEPPIEGVLQVKQAQQSTICSERQYKPTNYIPTSLIIGNSSYLCNPLRTLVMSTSVTVPAELPLAVLFRLPVEPNITLALALSDNMPVGRHTHSL
jgi:hypothetical protein